MPDEAADLLNATGHLPATVHTSDAEDGAVCIDLICVPAPVRGHGHATAALAAVVAWADETGTTLTLAATAALGSDLKRLVALYRRFQFTPTAITGDGDVRMVRTPAKGFSMTPRTSGA